MHPGFRQACLAAGVWALAGVAGGQTGTSSEAPAQRAQLLTDLAACRLSSDDSARLACYDRVALALEDAERTGEVVVVERSQVVEARRALFGFSMPALSPLFRGSDEDRISSVDTTIQSASRSSSGKWRLTLADGSVWMQTDTTTLVRAPREGTPVSIREAAIGSYFLSVNGARSMRARREQ